MASALGSAAVVVGLGGVDTVMASRGLLQVVDGRGRTSRVYDKPGDDERSRFFRLCTDLSLGTVARRAAAESNPRQKRLMLRLVLGMLEDDLMQPAVESVPSTARPQSFSRDAKALRKGSKAT
jgi:hypothetical protein